jgi:hypothetical protein
MAYIFQTLSPNLPMNCGVTTHMLSYSAQQQISPHPSPDLDLIKITAQTLVVALYKRIFYLWPEHHSC